MELLRLLFVSESAALLTSVLALRSLAILSITGVSWASWPPPRLVGALSLRPECLLFCPREQLLWLPPAVRRPRGSRAAPRCPLQPADVPSLGEAPYAANFHSLLVHRLWVLAGVSRLLISMALRPPALRYAHSGCLSAGCDCRQPDRVHPAYRPRFPGRSHREPCSSRVGHRGSTYDTEGLDVVVSIERARGLVPTGPPRTAVRVAFYRPGRERHWVGLQWFFSLD